MRLDRSISPGRIYGDDVAIQGEIAYLAAPFGVNIANISNISNPVF